MPNSDEGQDSNARVNRPDKNIWARVISYIKAKINESKARKEKEPPADKSARITANATRLMAIFTVVLALSAIYQFIVLDSQLDVMRNDQRAWISIRFVGNQAEIGKPYVAAFIVQNTGKTLAKKVEGHFKMEILNEADEPNFDYSDNRLLVRWEGLMVPNVPQSIGVTHLIKALGTEIPQPTIYTEDLKNRFDSRRIWMAIEGQITYFDIFGRKHWYNVCFANFNPGSDVSSTPPGSTPCSSYNKTDD